MATLSPPRMACSRPSTPGSWPPFLSVDDSPAVLALTLGVASRRLGSSDVMMGAMGTAAMQFGSDHFDAVTKNVRVWLIQLWTLCSWRAVLTPGATRRWLGG